jgi:hypothetical protein
MVVSGQRFEEVVPMALGSLKGNMHKKQGR